MSTCTLALVLLGLLGIVLGILCRVVLRFMGARDLLHAHVRCRACDRTRSDRPHTCRVLDAQRWLGGTD